MITQSLIEMTAKYFSQEASFNLPPQDLDIDFTRMPALPKDRLQVVNVRPK
jgi:hypothetical protein